MMTEQRPSDDTHDTLIRLKENIEYFQDSVIGDLQDLDKKFEERLSKVSAELCTMNKRIAECEKDMIRKQGECDGHKKDTAQNDKDLDEFKKTVEKSEATMQKKFDDLKEQHRKDLAVAMTLTSVVVGLVTFIVTFVLSNR